MLRDAVDMDHLVINAYAYKFGAQTAQYEDIELVAKQLDNIPTYYEKLKYWLDPSGAPQQLGFEGWPITYIYYTKGKLFKDILSQEDKTDLLSILPKSSDEIRVFNSLRTDYLPKRNYVYTTNEGEKVRFFLNYGEAKENFESRSFNLQSIKQIDFIKKELKRCDQIIEELSPTEEIERLYPLNLPTKKLRFYRPIFTRYKTNVIELIISRFHNDKKFRNTFWGIYKNGIAGKRLDLSKEPLNDDELINYKMAECMLRYKPYLEDLKNTIDPERTTKPPKSIKINSEIHDEQKHSELEIIKGQLKLDDINEFFDSLFSQDNGLGTPFLSKRLRERVKPFYLRKLDGKLDERFTLYTSKILPKGIIWHCLYYFNQKHYAEDQISSAADTTSWLRNVFTNFDKGRDGGKYTGTQPKRMRFNIHPHTLKLSKR